MPRLAETHGLKDELGVLESVLSAEICCWRRAGGWISPQVKRPPNSGPKRKVVSWIMQLYPTLVWSRYVSKGREMSENPSSPSGGQKVFRVGVQEVIPVNCPRWTLSDAPVIAELEADGAHIKFVERWGYKAFSNPRGRFSSKAEVDFWGELGPLNLSVSVPRNSARRQWPFSERRETDFPHWIQ